MIRLSNYEYLNQIKNIYAHAREFMRINGNPNQWINNYPSDDIIISDINNKWLYVCYDEDIYAVFVFFMGIDETYNYIEGAWLNNEDYGVIHRIASMGTKKGIFREVFSYVTSFIDNIKIDTHSDNLVMQGVLNKHGFKKCGTIYLKNGSKRLAYQYIKGGK